LPLYKDVSAKLSVVAPKAGYIVPPAFVNLVESKLRIHGIVSQRLYKGLTAAVFEQFHTDTASLAAQPFESHQALSITGQWRAQQITVAAGSLFVPIAQPKARLVMALLEPQAPDSLLAWGFFNNQFERKEYMEDYVAEEVAHAMLKDPAIKDEFELRLKTDKVFATSAQQRLEFFARKHSSWDERYQVYPVIRTDTVPNP
jgi:hypothetical protein